jgi:cysteine synthase A
MSDAVTGALALIGNTPLLRLARIATAPLELHAKAEFVQPGGSVKDRAALEIIRSAYADGRLVPGRPVVEMTSGNMGAGLAVVCNVHGNPFTAVMSAGNSPERAKMMRAMGADVVLVPQVDGRPGQVTGADIDAAEKWARQLARDRGGFYVDQFNNPGSVRAHEAGTGPEIWRELGTRLGGFAAAVGSAGTFVGTARYLKRMNPAIVCAAVEPEGAEVLAGRGLRKPRHLLQGTGYGIVPPQWEAGLADVFLAVSDDEAESFRRRLAMEEGLHIGYSAAANVCAALKLGASGRVGRAPVVVTVLCDTGFKY